MLDNAMIALLGTSIWETLYMVIVSMILSYAIGIPIGVILNITSKDGICPNRPVNAVLGVIVSVAAGLVCGGGGVALIATGPLGFLAGVAVGAAASLLGWNALSGAIERADIPLLLRRVGLEKRLRSESVRRELRERLAAELSASKCAFSRQVVEDFSKSFRGYVYAVAQAAEIPIG